jgi:hypothetical protein
MTDSGSVMKRLGENLKSSLGGEQPKRPLHRHHDDDYWDSVEVEATGAKLRAYIVPRYKTSGLSGDEWRISAHLEVGTTGSPKLLTHQFHRMKMLLTYAPHFLYAEARYVLDAPAARLVVRRKGVVLMQQHFATFGDAAMGMAWHVTVANEGSKAIPWHHLTDAEERERCQQVGCSEPPKNVYRLKKLQVGNGRLMVEPEYDFTGQFTWYCSRHTERGDCGLEDADENMTLVEGSGVPVVRPEDESPSMVGGVIEVTLPGTK